MRTAWAPRLEFLPDALVEQAVASKEDPIPLVNATPSLRKGHAARHKAGVEKRLQRKNSSHKRSSQNTQNKIPKPAAGVYWWREPYVSPVRRNVNPRQLRPQTFHVACIFTSFFNPPRRVPPRRVY
jgi:hypothetical protein